MPHDLNPNDDRRGLHWSQWVHLLLIVGSGGLVLTLAFKGGGDPRSVLMLSVFFTLALGAVIRLVYPLGLRQRHLRARRQSPEGSVFVTWAISDRALFVRARYPSLGKGWAIVAVASGVVRVWNRRELDPVLPFPPYSIASFALGDVSRGPVVAVASDGQPAFALFPVFYQGGEYFQSKGINFAQ